jgi:hypothetical protein
VGFRDWLLGTDSATDTPPVDSSSEDDRAFPSVTLSELETDYEPVGFTSNGVPMMTRRLADTDEVTDVQTDGEITGSGATQWRLAVNSDYNPLLSGNQGIEQYREMRNDSIVRSSMRVAKTPVLSARWFMQPASNEDADVEKADFVWKNLTQWMSMSWPQFLVETLYMMDYGFYAFEKVFVQRQVAGETRIVWRKFSPRHPLQIEEFVYDDEGGPEVVRITTEDGSVDLPIQKALVFTYDKEGGNLFGHAVLRSAYKHWFFKETLYKIDAIQKERHSIGIPIIVLPPNFTDGDRKAAERIGVNLRTNESAHVVLPPNWQVMFLKLDAAHSVDALASAQHHADKLYENVLANFLVSDTKGDADVQEHVFTRSVRFTAEIIRDVLNKYAIPQLMLLNWPEEEFENGFPELKVRRLGDERDWRVLSFAVRNLIGSGTIRPDDKLEAWAREELDMPVADLETTRYIVEEQSDPVGSDDFDPNVDPNVDEAGTNTIARPPRQSQAGNMRQAQSPGSRNTGRDAGGVSGS